MPIPKFKAFLNRLDILVLGLLFLINGVVVVNAIRHLPTRGYDSEHHYANMVAISTGRLPTPTDSREFFSPPLPYILPAFLIWISGWELEMVGKFAQMLNVLLSIGVTIYILKICELVRPSGVTLKRGALLSLALIPVYYKTFALVRGEPFIVFFAIQSAYLALLVMDERRLSPRRMMELGVTLGLGLLSRQWGALLIPPIIFFICIIALKAKLAWRHLLSGLALCLGIAFILSGWFYIHLKINYGSVTAFNRPPQTHFSLFNQPVDFYIGLGGGKLFSEPVRDSFPNQFVPIFYSEIWGDYWFYFLVFGKDKRNDDLFLSNTLYEMMQRNPWPRWFRTNRETITPYLANLNRVGLLPTILALAAIIVGTKGGLRFIFDFNNDNLHGAMCLFMGIISVSWLGYLWFLIMYPNPNGDTIKATYMLHLFPLIAILMGSLLLIIQQRLRIVNRMLMIMLVLVLLYNLPAFFSRVVVGD